MRKSGGETNANAVDRYLRLQDLRLRRQRVIFRKVIDQLSGAEQLVEDTLEQLQATMNRRKDEDDTQERLFILGFLGHAHIFDELIDMANPELKEDPQFVELANRPFLKDPLTRAEFFVAIGMLGQRMGDRDFDRMKWLTRVCRRGLADDFPEVKIAAAGALAVSVKMHPRHLEHFKIAVPSLSICLADPGWQVRRAALEALRDIPHTASVEALTRHLSTEPDDILKRFTEACLERARSRARYAQSLGQPLSFVKDLAARVRRD